jgi:hypothetical protein
MRVSAVNLRGLEYSKLLIKSSDWGCPVNEWQQEHQQRRFANASLRPQVFALTKWL